MSGETAPEKSEGSTDSVTPTQPVNKIKGFTMPSKNGATPTKTCDAEKVLYDAMYSKQIKQKSKIWEDGLLEYIAKAQKVWLFYFNLFQFILYTIEN